MVTFPHITLSPVQILFFFAIISYLFSGKLFSFILIFGIVLVFIGAFFLQYRTGLGIFAQPRTFSLAVFAMIVYGIVTIMDARAVQIVEPMVQFVKRRSQLLK